VPDDRETVTLMSLLLKLSDCPDYPIYLDRMYRKYPDDKDILQQVVI
jgi:hypothetical protein